MRYNWHIILVSDLQHKNSTLCLLQNDHHNESYAYLCIVFLVVATGIKLHIHPLSLSTGIFWSSIWGRNRNFIFTSLYFPLFIIFLNISFIYFQDIRQCYKFCFKHQTWFRKYKKRKPYYLYPFFLLTGFFPSFLIFWGFFPFISFLFRELPLASLFCWQQMLLVSPYLRMFFIFPLFLKDIFTGLWVAPSFLFLL